MMTVICHNEAVNLLFLPFNLISSPPGDLLSLSAASGGSRGTSSSVQITSTRSGGSRASKGGHQRHQHHYSRGCWTSMSSNFAREGKREGGLGAVTVSKVTSCSSGGSSSAIPSAPVPKERKSMTTMASAFSDVFDG